ncbi:alpha/beta fold hydrolase [Sphingomicrobium sediminis]|uniref:Alpha/beta hydrolase n=1 Tax=Sphingomicrobium sediminis TaxID=2950949 RepID=A0A9X2J4D5_9SPHN|nr:alpha/beta hydrolase [Sphingomicrobium sediminis]MCM8558251.1 alpha/beta hydrolase [Sphingomicrobium sediminis]
MTRELRKAPRIAATDLHPDDRAPSGWMRMREMAWQLPRLLSSVGPIEPEGPKSGPPALVLPGFMASDRSTRQLRLALGRHGWHTHPWMLGHNRGASLELHERMCERIAAVGNGEKVLLVGWSLGGLYARELARACPDKVRAVVTLASPFAGDLKTNNNVRWLYERVAGHPVDDAPFPRIEDKPPVPTIAFYSRRDGIIAPRAGCGDERHCDAAIEIDTHHMGFAVWRPALSRIMLHLGDFLEAVEGRLPTPENEHAVRTARLKAARREAAPKPA